MSSQGEVTLPATRRTRKSIGGRSPKKSTDKENATLDLSSNMAGGGRKKTRSKSMGPGGLDILKSGTGNRRVSLAAPSRPPPRSILKPTIPLLPEIPSYRPQNVRSRSAGDILTTSFDSDNGLSGTKVALRTEEEQQAAAREREERERAALEKEIKDRREARRKSLANRRVSFAAEATLHTFHEVESMPEPASSASSSRRSSSGQQQHEGSVSNDSEPPSTPPEQVEEPDVDSTSNQRDLHQRKNRRSSAASTFFNAGDDDTATSTVYDSDLEHADGVTEIQGEEMIDSSDEDSDDDGTMMTVEAEEMTSASIASARSGFSVDDMDDDEDLDENLRLAARMAVTQSVGDDEEVIAGFAGWGKKNVPQSTISRDTNQSTAAVESPQSSPMKDVGSDAEMDMDMDMDMEMTKAVGGILRQPSASPDKEDGDDMDMSMDVTKAIGGILSQSKPLTRRKSIKPPSQQASEDVTSYGDQTMEFTVAVGGIRQGRASDVGHDETEINEDMSMEITTAIGGVLSGNIFRDNAQQSRRRTISQDDDANEGSLMEITAPVGRILPADDANEEDTDQTMGMDMTMAVGGIIKSVLTPEDQSAAAKETGEDEVAVSVPITKSPRRRRSAVVDENGSPSSIVFSNENRRSVSPVTYPALPPPEQPEQQDSPFSSPFRSPSPRSSPMRLAETPAVKTPPAMIGSRSSSPVRIDPVESRPSPRSPTKTNLKLFLQDPRTGMNTPSVVLTPQPRRLSGVGADRPGLGSPRVAEVFDRRESIGEAAASFTPIQLTNVRRAVAFADPRELEAEVDKEREEEEGRENGRRILEREADGPQEEVTLNIRELIQGLSPAKKNPLRGRKSLAFGSGRGLLGKRPKELDDDDDDEADEQDGVKRLKGHQGSPVKNIRLQSPPSKAETMTGRKMIASNTALEQADNDTTTPTTAVSPIRATTPQATGRFINISDDQPTHTMDFTHTAPIDEAEAQRDDDGERIHLQDFLNLTSIRFMELTTTKRRHTIAPGASRDSTAADGKGGVSFEKCVVAGACTVPMLELYQHSCRELKKYISEGRRIVRDIETETFEENPPLFREYISASPEFKVLMDNQFKNVKSHARLLSKAMWYEWRMKLQEGLKEGLLKTVEGMDKDDELLKKQQELLTSVLPPMIKTLESLERQHDNLEAIAKELADCDPEDLETARSELLSLDSEIAEKARKIAELRQQLEESESGIQVLTEQKQECLDAIKGADKVREECRGWSTTEISALKAKVDKLERKHGWAITGISPTNSNIISMSYKREIEITFDVSSLQQDGQQQQSDPALPAIELRYIADKRERSPLPSTPEKEFFLQRIREHVRSLPRATTRASRLLGVVSAAWEKAKVVAEQLRLLNLSFPTTIIDDSLKAVLEDGSPSSSSIRVRSSVLMVPMQTRVEVVLTLQCTTTTGEEAGGGDIEVTVAPAARVVYGEQFNEAKLTEFLATRVGGSVLADGSSSKASWSEAVLELQRRCLAKKGLKGQGLAVPTAGGQKKGVEVA